VFHLRRNPPYCSRRLAVVDQGLERLVVGLQCAFKRSIQYLSGPLGYVASGIIILWYLVLALYPFHWNPCHKAVNGARIAEDGVLYVVTEGYVRATTAAPWADAVRRLGHLRILMRVKPFADQGAILSYADWDGSQCNILIGQQGSDLTVFLRARGVQPYHPRCYVSPGVFSTLGWRNIEVILTAGAIVVVVDGREVVSDSFLASALEHWDSRFALVLANVANGSRPWRGAIATCIMEAGKLQIDYLASSETHIPAEYWINLKYNSRPYFIFSKDFIANFVCFIPLGFVLGCIRGKGGSFVLAASFCFVLSGVVELTQFGFEHLPDINDWITNTLGGTLGAMAARRGSNWLHHSMPYPESLSIPTSMPE